MSEQLTPIIADMSDAATFFNEEKLCNTVSDALDYAKKLGANAAEAGISVNQGLQASVRMGELQTLEHNRDRTLSITLYKHQNDGVHKGSASCGDLKLASVREAVEQAYAIACHTEGDSASGLAEAEQMATIFHPLDLWHPNPQAPEDLIDQSLAIEQAGRDVDARIFNSEGAQSGYSMAMGVYANTHGFLGRASGTSFSRSVALVASDDSQEGMQRDYAWDQTRRFSDLGETLELGQQAAKKTIARLGAKSIPTCSAPILFTAEVASGLLRNMVSALTGGNLYRQSSFLTDKVGTSLFPGFVQIAEDPHRELGINSANYDSDGVATGLCNPLIVDGIIQRYILSAYSARRMDLKTTGNAGGVRNLTIKPGEKNLQELIKTMHKGFVVTEMMGQGINIVNGDYSRGAGGFWVENGEIAHPVQEVTIAGNLKDMFAGLVELGNDVDTRGNMCTPSWLVNQMMIAGD